MLQLTELTKSYDGAAVLRGLNLRVARGEVVALLGPSGSGKTTVLRLIAGFEQPDSGSITLDGRDLATLPPARRSVRVAFQTPLLYPFMKVHANVVYPSRCKTPADHDKLRSISRMLEIEPILGRWPSQLSGGETQRVALAKILFANADIYLLDEPLSDVDPLLARKLQDIVTRELAGRRAAVLYVTHNQFEATAVSDTIAILKAGVLQQVGPSSDLIQKPATPFVAQFFGDPAMPFLSAELAEQQDGVHLVNRSLGLNLRLAHELDRHSPEAARVLVGIRGPLVRRAPVSRGSPACISGVVLRAQHQFENVLLSVETADGVLRVSAPATNEDPEDDWTAGTDVLIDLSTAILHLFDVETELPIFRGHPDAMPAA